MHFLFYPSAYNSRGGIIYSYTVILTVLISDMIRHRRIQGPRASWSADDRHWDPWRNNLVTSTGLQGPLLRCVFEIASGGEIFFFLDWLFLMGRSGLDTQISSAMHTRHLASTGRSPGVCVAVFGEI